MRGWHLALSVAIGCAIVTRPVSSRADAMAPSVTGASAAAREGSSNPDYRLQPGDTITISVWKEKDLQAEVLVRPDGGISFPLTDDIRAAGHTVGDVRAMLAERLKNYIPDPVVTVAIKGIGGNHVYVLGKVLRPGEFPFSRPVDVVQALSLAGGATPYAALNEIVILRRDTRGGQRVLRFRYGDVSRGKHLEQNVLLESGDTVVVP